jgi:GT2 family glycosyltransferase
MTTFGIAIITYERRHLLEGLLGSIAELTGTPYELAVADDGSRDGTLESCRDRGLRIVSGQNRGVAWNKNRALFALAALECDPIVLMEDDVYPTAGGWERDWIEGTRRWGHLAYHDPKIAHRSVSGAGTPSDPYVNPSATAQCLSLSAEALEAVGYFDSRFQGWGHEHAEWTTRIKRTGHGYKVITLPDGRRPKAQLYLSGGLADGRSQSFRDPEQVRRNLQVAEQLENEPLFRLPWRGEAEQQAFLAEQASAGIDGTSLAARLEYKIGRDKLAAESSE